MNNELQDVLNEILQDKNTNLLPENLKAGITCLGVEGNMTNNILYTLGQNISIDHKPEIGEDIDITYTNDISSLNIGDYVYGLIYDTTTSVFDPGNPFGGHFDNIGYYFNGEIKSKTDTKCVCEITKLNIRTNGSSVLNPGLIPSQYAVYYNNDRIIGQAVSVGNTAGNATKRQLFSSAYTLSTDFSYMKDGKDIGVYCANNMTVRIDVPFTDLAEDIGLTADKIKSGETILGIEGTYEGESTSEFNEFGNMLYEYASNCKTFISKPILNKGNITFDTQMFYPPIINVIRGTYSLTVSMECNKAVSNKQYTIKLLDSDGDACVTFITHVTCSDVSSSSGPEFGTCWSVDGHFENNASYNSKYNSVEDALLATVDITIE